MSKKAKVSFNYKSNNLSPAEKAKRLENALQENTKKDERKAAELVHKITKGLAERESDSKIKNSFKLPRNRRSRSVPRISRAANINKMSETKKHRSADDIEKKHKVANDHIRDRRMKKKIRDKTLDLMDRITLMPLDMQDEIYSWIQDPPKTPHLSKPRISKAEVLQYPDQVLLEVFMRNKDLLDSLIYERVWNVFNEGGVYHTSMFADDDEECAAIGDYTSEPIILHRNKPFATSYEEFKDETKIEYNVTGDFIRFRVIPKYIKQLSTSEYDGLIVVDRYDVEEDTDDEEEEYYDQPDLIPRFSDRVRYIMRKYFSEIHLRYVHSHNRIVFNGQKYSMIHLDRN